MEVFLSRVGDHLLYLYRGSFEKFKEYDWFSSLSKFTSFYWYGGMLIFKLVEL